MDFIKKAPLFLLVLGSLWYVGLFSYFNQGIITIEVPYIGNFRVALAITILVSFVSGAIFASIFYGYDSMRKAMMLRSNKKTIKSLQNSIDHPQPHAPAVVADAEPSAGLVAQDEPKV